MGSLEEDLPKIMAIGSSSPIQKPNRPIHPPGSWEKAFQEMMDCYGQAREWAVRMLHEFVRCYIGEHGGWSDIPDRMPEVAKQACEALGVDPVSIRNDYYTEIYGADPAWWPDGCPECRGEFGDHEPDCKLKLSQA